MDIWSAGSGMAGIPYNIFIKETEDMLDRFFSSMEKQIEDVKNYFEENKEQKEYTLYDYDVEKGIEYLFKEQEEYKKSFYGKIEMLKNKTYKYDFDKLIKDYEIVNEIIREHKGKLL